MTTFLEKINKKINEQFSPEGLSLIDKSNLHAKHKSFNANKFYIKLIIKSKKLKDMGKIEAHKVIFSALKNEMKNDIHALEIEIK
tara:strand:+ start:5146 stop:5400 length:255 start_codon:yes stop_codon:yes gene_type:complete